MSEASLFLPNAPIVEAIVDINCDTPPVDLLELESRAAAAFQDGYPKSRKQVTQRHKIQIHKDPSELSENLVREEISALQFLSTDERQLVQVRQEGFSFNRLAPYTILDDYLAEIERTWGIFRTLTQPAQIRRIGLRFINRLFLPTIGGQVELNDYLRTSPRLPDEATLEFIGFLNQHAAIEVGTQNHVNITLLMQELEGDKLPLIFDIEAYRASIKADPKSWEKIPEPEKPFFGRKIIDE